MKGPGGAPNHIPTTETQQDHSRKVELRDYLKKNETLSALEAFAQRIYSKRLPEAQSSDLSQNFETRLLEDLVRASSLITTGTLRAVGAMQERERGI